MTFLAESAVQFESFLKFFQSAEPRVHLLYPELIKISTFFLIKILKSEVLQNWSNIFSNDGVEELLNSDNLIGYKHIELPRIIPGLMASCSDFDRIKFAGRCRDFWTASVRYILMKSSISKPLLKRLSCLEPNNVVKHDFPCEIAAVSTSIRSLNVSPDDVKCEAVMLASDVSTVSSKKLLDFWMIVFKSSKYPNLSKVVKAAFSLSSGNSEVERGFSLSGAVLTAQRSNMSLKTLNSRLVVQDAIFFYEKIVNICINPEMLSLARGARASYVESLRLQAEAKRKELRVMTKEKLVEEEHKRRHEEECIKKAKKAKLDEKKSIVW